MQNGEVDFGRAGDALGAKAKWNLQDGVLRLQRISSKAGRQLLQDISASCPSFWWSFLASALRRFQSYCVLQPHKRLLKPTGALGSVFEVSAPPIDRSVVL